MTKNEYQFLCEFHERLIQPIIDKLDEDQTRQHHIVHEPFGIELANIIRSLKVVATSRASFRVEFNCMGDYVVATMRKNSPKNPRLKHSLWELHNLLELAEVKQFSFPRHHHLSHLRKGIWGLLQILDPEEFGKFNRF